MLLNRFSYLTFSSETIVAGERIKIAVIGGSPSVGVGAGAAGTYLTAFKSWLQASFTDAPPEVLELAMAKATAGIAARCASLNAEDADIVIIELLHDEPHSTEEVDRVPGVRCDRSDVSFRSSTHSAAAGWHVSALVCCV